MRHLSRVIGNLPLFLAGLILLLPNGTFALPARGTPAPALEFTNLLQAPAGTKTDWAALHGKVVVLEFWATWCAPCVAAIPHWNELVGSVDPSKVAFISVDDEDPTLVETFLTKKKFAGWTGIDTTGEVFKRYGVKGRPTTIIVDGEGRIAATTLLDLVKADDLTALAAGKKVELPSVVEPDFASMQPTGQKETGKAIFEISISKVKPEINVTMSTGPDGQDIHGVDAAWLLTIVYNTLDDRLVINGKLPDDHYNLHTRVPDMDATVTDSLVQKAVAAGLHLDIRKKRVTRNVYLLQATPASQQLIVPSAIKGSSRMNNQGTIHFANEPIEVLARELENWVKVPVIDETGIQTRFDARLDFSSKDLQSLNEVLTKTLGLRLSEAAREIEVFEVTPLPEEKSAKAAVEPKS